MQHRINRPVGIISCIFCFTIRKAIQRMKTGQLVFAVIGADTPRGDHLQPLFRPMHKLGQCAFPAHGIYHRLLILDGKIGMPRAVRTLPARYLAAQAHHPEMVFQYPLDRGGNLADRVDRRVMIEISGNIRHNLDFRRIHAAWQMYWLSVPAGANTHWSGASANPRR